MDKTLTNELKSHFLRLYQIAFSDDKFSVPELKMLYELADRRGVAKSELDSLLLNPVTHSNELPLSLNTRIEYLYDFGCMIIADGIITEDERNAFKKYCKIFEFLDENIEGITNYLLNCIEQGTSKDDIIKQLNS